MMRATVGYDYARDKWCVYAVGNIGKFIKSAEEIMRMLTDEGRYLYPCWFDAEIDSYTYKNGKFSVEFSEGVEFPAVTTLEQSIERNKNKLKGWVAK